MRTLLYFLFLAGLGFLSFCINLVRQPSPNQQRPRQTIRGKSPYAFEN